MLTKDNNKSLFKSPDVETNKKDKFQNIKNSKVKLEFK